MSPYFAYGSNLCFPRFVARVPTARFIAVAKLPSFKVVFHKRSSKDQSGKATIVDSDRNSVYGVLYAIDAESDLKNLRKAEGYPQHYREVPISVHTLDGSIKAMTYIATQEYYDETQVPYDWYVDHIRFGARRFGIPEDYLTQFDSVTTKRDLDTTRVAEERAFLR